MKISRAITPRHPTQPIVKNFLHPPLDSVMEISDEHHTAVECASGCMARTSDSLPVDILAMADLQEQDDESASRLSVTLYRARKRPTRIRNASS
jgi:hypothetical protein